MEKANDINKNHTCRDGSSDNKENKTEDSTEDTCCLKEEPKKFYMIPTSECLKKSMPTIILVVMFVVMLAVTLRLVFEWMGLPI